MEVFLKFPVWYENKEIYGHYKCKEDGNKYFATSYNDILGWYEYTLPRRRNKEELKIMNKPIKEKNKIFFIENIKIYQGRVLVVRFDTCKHKYIFHSYSKEKFLEKFEREE